MDDADDMDDGMVNEIELDDGDAAIVVRTSGDIESFLPILDDESSDDVMPGSPTMMVAVLVYLLSDQNRYRALEQEFLELCHANVKTDSNKMLH